MTVSVDKKTLKIIFSFCLLAIVICIVVCGFEILSTSSYLKGKGTLISVDRSIDNGLTDNSQSTIIRYKKYSYTVANQEYTCQYRTYLLIGNKIGCKKNIYYSPLNPNKVRDEFKIEIAIFGIVFFAFFGIIMLIFMKKLNENE